MASTYTPIATTTLGSAASSVTFSSIPQTYTDLIVISDMAYTSTSTTYQGMQVGNGSVDTGNNYGGTFMGGSGTAASSGRNTDVPYYNFLTNATGTVRTQAITQIMNYSNTTTYKTELTRMIDVTSVYASVYTWRSTSAINIIKIIDIFGNNFATGSTFTVYGIKAA
jgi:hypothetical protein